MNKVLVIGSGGREHALAWRLSQSTTVEKTYVAPGNAGTELEADIENVSLDPTDFAQVVAFCQQHQVSLVVVGPEQPLVDGMVDALSQAGINCFGPSAKAAQLEGSKAFAKEFLQRHSIPTATYGEFTDVAAAYDYLNTQSFPVVIKADGLAAGKGVVIATDLAEAQATVDDMLAGNKFGDAGSRIIIEEFLVGEEASYIVIADGKNFISMATSQDHKARDNGDVGPNTGGMGAYSPAPVVTPAIDQQVAEKVIQATLDGMAKDGAPFTGFLYAGLMIDANGQAKVLEFNVRFGDPETQPIMLRLQSNLDELCLAAIKGQLAGMRCEWDQRFALGVVMAEDGYPFSYAKGNRVDGLDAVVGDTKVFHAGTAIKNEQVVTSGGRVLCVCALADDLKQAQSKAYERVKQINWGSEYYRTDIGFKAL
ncbi:phosphoribosylamine--glycine ligase [Marinicella sp. S1101]|uniref:phosphoribosylamine--glycine ligase n=1 Tax=Marinicella marina TaxID=2996016 RepID=UPI0022608768|nr:phosphoribosylamine--glycine ligase [Marinicella marina]MCX7552893.1 phosphoribosylamine--glycine ligase [Marinicella marina]MDJ1139798.1 phosphoribosylamine--glycine ligase [Marinicella marina]